MPFDGTKFEQQDAVLERLRRGREMVARPDGWCKFKLRAGDRVCSLGALDIQPAYIVCEPVICLYLALPFWTRIWRRGNEWSVLVSYNNFKGRTQAEIVALYDRAIATRERGPTG